MRLDELTTDFLTLTQQLRHGEGLSAYDSTIVNSPAGAVVELNRFTVGKTAKVSVGFGVRIIVKGSVANNANVKSIALGVNSLNPSGQIVVTPAINTANVWLIDCTFVCTIPPTTFAQFGVTYTGPQNGVVTATTLYNLIDTRAIDFAPVGGPPTFFIVIGSQVAAGDIRLNGLYVMPLRMPA